MSPPIWGFPSVDFVRLLFFPFIKIPRPNPAACCTRSPREQRRVRGVECPLPLENGSEKITSGKRTDPPKHRHWIRSCIVSPPWCPLQPARSQPPARAHAVSPQALQYHRDSPLPSSRTFSCPQQRKVPGQASLFCCEWSGENGISEMCAVSSTSAPSKWQGWLCGARSVL